MSGRPVRVLVVENQEDDAELIIEELRRAGKRQAVASKGGYRGARRNIRVRAE